MPKELENNEERAISITISVPIKYVNYMNEKNISPSKIFKEKIEEIIGKRWSKMKEISDTATIMVFVIITEIKSKKNQGVYILGLSKKEVEDLYLGLKILIIKELNEK